MFDHEWLAAHRWDLVLAGGLFVFAWVGTWILQRILAARLRRLQRERIGVLHLQLLRPFVPLVRWGLIFASVAVAVHLLDLSETPQGMINKTLQGGFTILAAYAAAAAARIGFERWAAASGDAAAARTRATLAPVLTRSCRIFFLIIAGLLVLQNAGFNVAGLIAGLGIGGLAIALAAKETLANLFGSIAVLMDHTFQVGDKIQQGAVIGVVESIGLRSTRVRTAEGHLVSIPNQLITNAPVINMGPGK